MPLKHLTETVLIVVLGIAILVTGIVVSTLPHLPEGFMPWAVVSFLTVVYPAVLYPFLKKNRADYAFRSLHFVPFCMTVLWLLIEIVMLKDPRLSVLHRIYTWGWVAPAVIVSFFLIVGFCLHVIRRRVPRLTFLGLLLVPFLAVAAVNEQSHLGINTRLASALWGRFDLIAVVPPTEQPKPTETVAMSSKGEKNLSTSSVPEEEEWRKKLRDVEAGKTHSSSKSPVVTGTVTGVKETSKLVSSVSKPVAVVPKPGEKEKLPKSGGEFESIALFMLAGYCATVHRRARRRVIA